MAGTANVFGRQTSSDVARSVLSSPVLNNTGAPATPLQMPSDELSRAYARLLAACYDVRKHETDAMRLMELEQCTTFADRAYTSMSEGAEPIGPPVSAAPPQPAPPVPQAGAPQPGPMPQAAGPGASPQIPGAPPPQ